MKSKNGIFSVLYAIFFFFLLVSCATAPVTTNNNSGGTAPLVLDPGVYVSTSGSDANSGTNAANPMLTIQLAVSNAAVKGLTNVYVAQGIYKPGAGLNSIDNGIRINLNNIHLYGGYSSDFSSRPGKSELDGTNGLDQIVIIFYAQNILIDGFVIRNGNADNSCASGLFLYGATNCTVTNTVISNNYGNSLGGGIYIADSVGNTISAEILDNSGNSGGGIYLDGGVVSNTFDCVIARNIARGGNGGGILVYNSRWNTFTGTIVSNNTLQFGGGISLSGCHSNTINATVAQNMSTNSGGGMFVSGCRYLTIQGQIVSNTANAGSGGGIWFDTISNVIITNAVIGYNWATGSGGIRMNFSYECAIFGDIISNSSDNTGAGMFIYCGNSNYIAANISHNTSTGGGGGVYLYHCTNTFVSGSFNGNKALNDSGGGIFAWGIFNLMIEAGFFNNCSSNGGGGAILLDYSTNISIVNSYFTNNWSYSGYPTGNCVIYLYTGLTNLLVSNCTIGGSVNNYAGVIGIKENGAMNGHVLMDNTFATNTLTDLYLNSDGTPITTGWTWTNINAASYSGASYAGGNKVTNL